MAVFLCLALLIGFGIVSGFVGLVSNMVDSVTTFPVFLSVVLQKDISCMTGVLMIQFLVAVCLKAVLFLWRPVPWPFRAGLAVQAFLVVGISIQFLRIQWAHRTFGRTESSSDEADVSDASF
jgi:hypothetical protein